MAASDHFRLAISGDTIITRKVSTCTADRFRDYVELFRDVDASYTHLETCIHDFDRDDIYPAAEPGGNWIQSPSYVAEELEWLGHDIVSHASNHAMDYHYGGLRSTLSLLQDVGIPAAGTGENLHEARMPAYYEAGAGRIGVISMTSCVPGAFAASELGPAMTGRPGVNPLRYDFCVNDETMETIVSVAKALGFWIERENDETLLIHPPGRHNAGTRFRITDDGLHRELNERDRSENLRYISDASDLSDLLLVHVHTHEWDITREVQAMAHPAEFFPPFARDCVDAGADVVVIQGSHAPLRGIEVYDDAPIFYDPGDFFFMIQTLAEKFPADPYYRHEEQLEHEPWEALPAELHRAMQYHPEHLNMNVHPEQGFYSGDVIGNIVPVCSFDEDFELTKLELTPGTWLGDDAFAHEGIPARATGGQARTILEYVSELSAEYGTQIEIEDEHGHVVL